MKKRGPFVIVRTYSAGVHCGTLIFRKGREVVLSNARRLWLSEPVKAITLTEAIEVIVATPEAAKNLSRSRWSS